MSTLPTGPQSEFEVRIATQLEAKAWSFLTLERTARLGTSEAAYADELGVRYVYDSRVAHHANVQAGDLAVLRDDKVVLGAGQIDAIHILTQAKIRQRCPSCKSTAYKFRTTVLLPFRCSACSAEFAETDKSDVSNVRAYTADYGRTWRPADAMFPVNELARAYITRAVQHSIRQLDTDLLRPILRKHLVADIWWDNRSGDTAEIPGGYGPATGKSRLGQQRFREEMLGRFGARCAFTGRQPPETLEAAHVRAFSASPRHETLNGLLLRRDLHALFDRGLITIDPTTWTIDVAPHLQGYPSIAELHGRPIDLPSALRPHKTYVEEHAATARAQWLRTAEFRCL